MTTTKMIKGKLECVIPSGKDAGQTPIITQALALGTIALNLDETNGYEVDIPTAKISGINFDNAGNDTSKVSFDFQNSGTFTIS